jgi:hypothetical protein
MPVRRFTQLTNAFSKKVENHTAAVSLHFMHYNLALIHKTLGITPAMEAGVTDHVWSLAEIVGLWTPRRPRRHTEKLAGAPLRGRKCSCWCVRSEGRGKLGGATAEP